MTRLAELLADLLNVAEIKLGVSVDELVRTVPLSGLESMLTDLLIRPETDDGYPNRVEAIAACAAWVVHHQPFGKESRDIANDFMRLQLRESRIPWPRPQEEAHEIEVQFEALEEGSISEARFVEWVFLRVATA